MLATDITPVLVAPLSKEISTNAGEIENALTDGIASNNPTTTAKTILIECLYILLIVSFI